MTTTEADRRAYANIINAPDPLAGQEKRAIASLKRLAKKWPETLWLFSASGSLWVMRCGPDGERMHLRSDGVDPHYAVESINIPNDGGDW